MPRLTGPRAVTWIQRSTDHPRYNHNEHRQYFHVTREYGAGLGVKQTSSGQGSLNNHLGDDQNVNVIV